MSEITYDALKKRVAEMKTALQTIANICLVTCLRPGIEAQKMQAIAFCALLKCNCGGDCNQYGLCKSKAIAALGEEK